MVVSPAITTGDVSCIMWLGSGYETPVAAAIPTKENSHRQWGLISISRQARSGADGGDLVWPPECTLEISDGALSSIHSCDAMLDPSEVVRSLATGCPFRSLTVVQ